MRPSTRFLAIFTLLLVVVVLVAAACARAAPTPTPTKAPPTPTPALTPTPTPTRALPTPTPTPAPTPTPTKVPTTPTPTPIPGPRGTVRVAYVSFEGESLDPSLQTISGKPYYQPMYDVFIGAESSGKTSFKLGVLENAEPDASGKVWTLTLKKGIRWHDGVEMTSQDTKFTLEYFARPEAKSVSSSFLKANLDRVEVVDNYTAKVYLKTANFLFPVNLGNVEGDLAVLPKHHFDKVGAANFDKTPLGSGPWKLAARKIGESIEWEANKDYWNPERIPGFARLRVELVPDAASRKAKLRAKEVDLIPLEPQDVKPMRDAGFQIMGPKTIASPVVDFYRNYDPAFLNSKLEFRKALALAIDMKAIVDAFYPPEVGTLAAGPPLFSPVTAGYDPSIPRYPYDVEQAKKLLRDVGYKGEEVSIWHYAFPGVPEIPELTIAIADYWRKAGVNVKVVDTDWSTFVTKMRQQDFKPPAAAAVTGAQARPSLIQNVQVYMLHSNDGGFIAGYPDPQEILADYRKLTGTADPGERDRLLRELGKKWYETYWAVPVVWRNGPWAVSSRVADWQPTSGTSTQLAYETLKPSAEVKD